MKAHRATSFQPGDWIPSTPYRVVRPLGVGGMGEVYEVDHTKAGTRRAIKVTRPFWENVLAGRLLREGRVLRSIDHPNVVRVFEVGSLSDGRPYFSMELLEGISLCQVVAKQAPVPWPLAVRFIVQALDGLASIHDRGVVHRDVKPSNLFLDGQGVVKVLDLGIAKQTNQQVTGPRTREGTVMGTMRYMAPEQWLKGTVDGRTDIYSVTLVLVELLSGCRISAGKLGADAVMAKRNLDVPPELLTIIRLALAMEPEDRFPDAVSMASALRVLVPLPPLVCRSPGCIVRVRRDTSLVMETPEPMTLPQGILSQSPDKRTWKFRPWTLGLGILLSLCVMVFVVATTWVVARDSAWQQPHQQPHQQPQCSSMDSSFPTRSILRIGVVPGGS